APSAHEAPPPARPRSRPKPKSGALARHVCNEAIQVHGGMGFTWELGLHRFLRRAKVIEHGFGSSTWHNERVLVETLRMQDADLDAKLAAA
ncbi:MAG: acyl-CoA dehydrogenase family protein, partial [Novosphingobium sp.]